MKAIIKLIIYTIALNVAMLDSNAEQKPKRIGIDSFVETGIWSDSQLLYSFFKRNEKWQNNFKEGESFSHKMMHLRNCNDMFSKMGAKELDELSKEFSSWYSLQSPTVDKLLDSIEPLESVEWHPLRDHYSYIEACMIYGKDSDIKILLKFLNNESITEKKEISNHLKNLDLKAHLELSVKFSQYYITMPLVSK